MVDYAWPSVMVHCPDNVMSSIMHIFVIVPYANLPIWVCAPYWLEYPSSLFTRKLSIEYLNFTRMPGPLAPIKAPRLIIIPKKLAKFLSGRLMLDWVAD